MLLSPQVPRSATVPDVQSQERAGGAVTTVRGDAMKLVDAKSVLDIVLYPNEVLTTPGDTIELFDSTIADFGQMLIDAIPSGGIAVAAHQLGLPLRMFSYRMSGQDPRVICNPKIIDSFGSWAYKEGCLSFPGMFWWIHRPRRILVEGYSVSGEKVTLEATDLKARVFQHEVDHLEGRLVLSRITLSERKKAFRELGIKKEPTR